MGLGHHLRQPLFGLLFLGRLNRPLFVTSVALAGATLPTLIIGLTPIASMLMLQHSMGGSRYRPIGWRALPPLVLAFAGVSLVVVSQSAGGMTNNWWLLATGTIAGLGAVVVAGLTTLDLVWGVGYARKIKPATTTKDETAASLFGTTLAAMAVMPCLLLAGLFVHSEAAILTALIPGAIIGIIIRAPFTILLRIANFETASVTINTIICELYNANLELTNPSK